MADLNTSIPELGSDADDDEALRYAIALSLQDQQQANAKKVGEDEDDKGKVSGVPSTTGHANFGSFQLDRKKMEQERLQRLGKRRQPDDDDDDVIEVPPPKKSAHANRSIASGLNIPFPNGVIKRTWARGYPRTSADIKIEEVFQKDQLLLAVLSSFQWDEEWIMSKLDLNKTKVLLMAYAADDAQKEAMRANVPPAIKFCFPLMKGPGSMHSKLQLLKFPEYLRIVIPTGNLVPYDWGENGVMENMVFLLDLPRLANSVQHRPTLFSTELARFLKAAGVDDKMVSSLTNYDFTKTENIGFVCTIPGSHTGDVMKRTGYSGLGTTVAALGLATDHPIEVDLVCASLGSINGDLVSAIYNACQGDDGMREYTARASRKAATKPDISSATWRDRFRIYFPTHRTVCESRGGQPAGGTICVQEKWWQAPTFPRDLIRDCVNTRKGLLMHSKMIFVRSTTDGSGKHHKSPGWAYVGSANFSESAWGRIVKDKSSGVAKISCRNWECGIVFPLPPSEEGKVDDSMNVFSGKVPVPMQTPGPLYAPGDKPWLFLGAQGTQPSSRKW